MFYRRPRLVTPLFMRLELFFWGTSDSANISLVPSTPLVPDLGAGIEIYVGCWWCACSYFCANCKAAITVHAPSTKKHYHQKRTAIFVTSLCTCCYGGQGFMSSLTNDPTCSCCQQHHLYGSRTKSICPRTCTAAIVTSGRSAKLVELNVDVCELLGAGKLRTEKN